MSGLDIRDAARTIRDTDLRTAILELADAGWQAVRRTGKCHLLIEHPPTGARVTASSSASDIHASRVLRRAARQAIARRSQARS